MFENNRLTMGEQYRTVQNCYSLLLLPYVDDDDVLSGENKNYTVRLYL